MRMGSWPNFGTQCLVYPTTTFMHQHRILVSVRSNTEVRFGGKAAGPETEKPTEEKDLAQDISTWCLPSSGAARTSSKIVKEKSYRELRQKQPTAYSQKWMRTGPHQSPPAGLPLQRRLCSLLLSCAASYPAQLDSLTRTSSTQHTVVGENRNLM